MGVINLSFRNSFRSQNKISDSNILCASGLSGSSIMTNEVTVITGASSGIGAALAKHLGSKGHQLVLAARREKELKEVAKQAGTRALVVQTDVTRRADVEDLRSRALKEYGHVDVWVNNAGRGITKSVLDLTDQDVDEITSVVLKSVLYGMQLSFLTFKNGAEDI